MYGYFELDSNALRNLQGMAQEYGGPGHEAIRKSCDLMLGHEFDILDALIQNVPTSLRKRWDNGGWDSERERWVSMFSQVWCSFGNLETQARILLALNRAKLFEPKHINAYMHRLYQAKSKTQKKFFVDTSVPNYGNKDNDFANATSANNTFFYNLIELMGVENSTLPSCWEELIKLSEDHCRALSELVRVIPALVKGTTEILSRLIKTPHLIYPISTYQTLLTLIPANELTDFLSVLDHPNKNLIPELLLLEPNIRIYSVERKLEIVRAISRDKDTQLVQLILKMQPKLKIFDIPVNKTYFARMLEISAELRALWVEAMLIVSQVMFVIEPKDLDLLSDNSNTALLEERLLAISSLSKGKTLREETFTHVIRQSIDNVKTDTSSVSPQSKLAPKQIAHIYNYLNSIGLFERLMGKVNTYSQDFQVLNEQLEIIKNNNLADERLISIILDYQYDPTQLVQALNYANRSGSLYTGNVFFKDLNITLIKQLAALTPEILTSLNNELSINKMEAAVFKKIAERNGVFAVAAVKTTIETRNHSAALVKQYDYFEASSFLDARPSDTDNASLYSQPPNYSRGASPVPQAPQTPSAPPIEKMPDDNETFMSQALSQTQGSDIDSELSVLQNQMYMQLQQIGVLISLSTQSPSQSISTTVKNLREVEKHKRQLLILLEMTQKQTEELTLQLVNQTQSNAPSVSLPHPLHFGS